MSGNNGPKAPCRQFSSYSPADPGTARWAKTWLGRVGEGTIVNYKGEKYQVGKRSKRSIPLTRIDENGGLHETISLDCNTEVFVVK